MTVTKCGMEFTRGWTNYMGISILAHSKAIHDCVVGCVSKMRYAICAYTC